MQRVCNVMQVSVQGVKSLGGHFACLCRRFEYYVAKKKMLFSFKKKMEILLHLLDSVGFFFTRILPRPYQNSGI